MAVYEELYSKIYEQVERINDQIADLDAKIEKLKTEKDFTIPEQIRSLEDQIAEVEKYEYRINRIRVSAEEHLITRNVQTIMPRPLNFNRLRNWSMMIDPMEKDDPYAQRVYVLCLCNMMFLQEKKQEYTERLAELKDVNIADAETKMKKLKQERTEAEAQFAAILRSQDMIDFADALRKAHESRMYFELPDEYEAIETAPEGIAIGAVGMPLNMPEEYREILKANLQDYYDITSGAVWFPKELPLSTEMTLIVSYSNTVDTKLVYRGLQNYLFRMMNETPAGEHQIYFMDALHYNSSILGALKVLEDTEVLKKLPRTPEQMEEALNEILSSFSDADEVLGLVDSVAEYNLLPDSKQKLPRTALFLVGYPNAFSSGAKEKIQRIMVNQERYGVTVIIANNYSEGKDITYDGIPEYIAMRAFRVVMPQKGYSLQEGETGLKQGFTWYGFPKGKELSKHYIESIKRLTTEKKSLGNEYPKRVEMSQLPKYTRGKKDLVLPIAVDAKDELFNIKYENENFAHFLMGASGSGKSTLLHNIITGIINNYHPDDVELWLADFKMSEFAQYMDPLPPHVKYILLDESRELVYDLIDRLTERMMERQRFFMTHREMKKVENVPDDYYMPVIFVILDEFSIMSQAVADSEPHKLKLQNILAKGRALGIKFVFSSQTFVKGIGGLTATAKDQIQTRLAMKNSSDEISQTLELSSSVKTDQVRNWIDALPPHYVLMKYREGDELHVKRLQVMYFPGKGDEALKPQRELIKRINQNYKPVPMEEYHKSEMTYVDKHPVLVDGNGFQPYNKEVLAKQRAEYQAGEGSEYQEDILISFGSPRRMEQVKFASLSEESRENMLLIARNNEIDCTMSILNSIARQVEEQGGKVHIWTYARNRVYRTYKDTIMASMDVCVGDGEIGYAIKELREKVNNGETGRDVYLLLGMDQICNDYANTDYSKLAGKKIVRKVVRKVNAAGEEVASTQNASEQKVSEQMTETVETVEVIETVETVEAVETEASASTEPFDDSALQVSSEEEQRELDEMNGEEADDFDRVEAEVRENHPEMDDSAVFAEVNRILEEGYKAAAEEAAEAEEAETEEAGAETVLAEDAETNDAHTSQAVDEEEDEGAEETAQAEETASEEDAAPAEENDSKEESVAEETVSVEEAAPLEESVPEEPAVQEASSDEVPAQKEVTEEIIEEVQEVSESGRPVHYYNAIPDLKYLMNQGSRMGYHFVMTLGNIKDISQTGLNGMEFNHKLGFQMSGDDSITVFGARAAASGLPEHICQYSNPIDRFSFRPYLYPGIGWDDWMVDDDGNLITMDSYKED